MKVDLWLQCFPGPWTVTQTSTLWYCHLLFVVNTELGSTEFKLIGEGFTRFEAISNVIIKYCEFQNEPAPLLLEA